MFVRLLCLLLLALNLGAAAWLVFGKPVAQPWPPVTDPGVPELRLLSELPKGAHLQAPAPALPAAAASTATPIAPMAATSVAAVAASSVVASAAAHDECTTLGPFDTTVDMRVAMKALSPHVARIQYHEEQVQQSRGYWVYLPAAASREAALEAARNLAARNVHDYYVVTAGDQQNMISLGLFNDEVNADKRVAELAAKGVKASIKQRFDTTAAYWVDFAVPPQAGFNWQAWLPGRNDLQVKPIDCF